MGFYHQRAWRDRTRQRVLLEANFTCADCRAQLLRGMHVHHVKELKRAPALGLEPLNLRALCVSCHTRAHGKRAAAGAGIDGHPLDPLHPWNQPRGEVPK